MCDRINVVTNLTKSFRDSDRVLFEDFGLQLERNTVLCILGSNGIGKTILLRCMLGLESCSGDTVSGVRIGYMPQKYRESLFPWLTVEANISYPLRFLPIDAAEKESIKEDLLANLPVTVTRDSLVSSLSGGESQIVALLRSLSNSPELLVLDEPFSNTDLKLREHYYRVLEDYILANSTSVIMTSHDIEECLLLATRVVILRRSNVTRVGADIPLGIPRPRSYSNAHTEEYNRCREILITKWSECTSDQMRGDP